MNLNELEAVKATIAACEAHGYQDVADALKDVLESEFAKVAESLHDSPH